MNVNFQSLQELSREVIRSAWAVTSLLVLLHLPGACGANQHEKTLSRDQGELTGQDPLGGREDTETFALKWQRSLPVDERDTGIGAIGGTETRSLVAMDGKLYAGIGYWSDAKEADPQLPGGQVLVLDSPQALWKVDLNLEERVKSGGAAGKRRYFAIAMLYAATFRSDLNGRALPRPAHMLLAGTWDRLGQLQVLSKTENAGSWSVTDLSPVSESKHAEIRSFSVYRDKVTNIEHAFAGARVNDVPDATRIYCGAFDPASGKVRWDQTPEAWAGGTPDLSRTTRASGRITGFVECNGKLYVSVYNMIFERQDGRCPSWKLVFRHDPQRPFEEGSSGFRGLTAVPDQSGNGEDLLVTLEHKPCIIFRIDTKTLQAVNEINVSAALQRQWGTPVGYVIAGYNDMLHYNDPSASESLTLIGFEAATPELAGKEQIYNPLAHYLVRQGKGRYAVREIADRSLDYRPNLRSVRTMVNSPFRQDPPGTVYAGGFDANKQPVHNTAWIYRGVRLNTPAR